MNFTHCPVCDKELSSYYHPIKIVNFEAKSCNVQINEHLKHFYLSNKNYECFFFHNNKLYAIFYNNIINKINLHNASFNENIGYYEYNLIVTLNPANIPNVKYIISNLNTIINFS